MTRDPMFEAACEKYGIAIATAAGDLMMKQVTYADIERQYGEQKAQEIATAAFNIESDMLEQQYQFELEKQFYTGDIPDPVF